MLNSWHYKAQMKDRQRLEDYLCHDNHKMAYQACVGACMHCEGEQKEQWVCELSPGVQHCSYCAGCFTAYYTKMKLKEKSINHSKWQPFDLVA